jgi:glycosyltransferase involved in cell wall biosynthesis
MHQISQNLESLPNKGGLRFCDVHKKSRSGEPLISIITVTFNSAKTLEETIKSVYWQEYKNIEYIVIDGGSTDDTLEIIRRHNGFIDYWISEKDKGIYDAMNKGISAATGDYIGILNSDDLFSNPRAVSLIANALQKYDADAVHGNIEIVNRNDISRIRRYYRSHFFSKRLLRFGIFPAHPTFYCRSSLYKDAGNYKTDYRVSADSEMIIRLLVGYKAKLVYIDETLVKMREGGISNNGVMGRIHQNFEIVRACRENSLYTNIFLLMVKIPIKLMQYFR